MTSVRCICKKTGKLIYERYGNDCLDHVRTWLYQQQQHNPMDCEIYVKQTIFITPYTYTEEWVRHSITMEDADPRNSQASCSQQDKPMPVEFPLVYQSAH